MSTSKRVGGGKAVMFRLQEEVEARIGKPIADILHSMFYDNDMSIEAIAKTLGVSYGAARRWCLDVGIEPRSRRECTLKARIACQLTHPTSTELAMSKALSDAGINFAPQFCVNGRFLCDFIVEDVGLVIECDGEYWHSLPGVMSNDKRKDKYLAALGLTVLHFTDRQIDHDIEGCLSIIKEAVAAGRTRLQQDGETFQLQALARPKRPTSKGLRLHGQALYEQTMEQYRLYQTGLTMSEIAKRYGVRQTSISNRFLKLGLETRPSNSYYKGRPGERHHNCKLTAAQVRDIRTRLANGESVASLVSHYHVSDATIRGIKKGTIWASVS